MRVIIDAREYNTYPPLTGKFGGGTELLLRHFAMAFKEGGHTVDVIAHEEEEHIVDGVYWHTPKSFPHKCDVLVACEKLDLIHEFDFKQLLVPLNKVDPFLGGREEQVDAFVVLSETHKTILLEQRPMKADQVVVIGPGVDIPEPQKKPGHRIIYCNAQERGLVHFARFWPEVKKRVPDAELVITYDLSRHLVARRFQHNLQGLEALEVWDWIESKPEGVTVIPGEGSSRESALRHQAASDLYAYPMDPPSYGTAVHALAAMEAASAGCALLLSKAEGLPEVYGDVAEFLNYPIVDEEWPEAIERILKDRDGLKATQKRSREWAKKHTWKKHHAAWRRLVSNGHTN